MRRKFGPEFKLKAVKLVNERGVSVAQACRDLDADESVLQRWMQDLAEAPASAFPGGAGRDRGAENGGRPAQGGVRSHGHRARQRGEAQSPLARRMKGSAPTAVSPRAQNEMVACRLPPGATWLPRGAILRPPRPRPLERHAATADQNTCRCSRCGCGVALCEAMSAKDVIVPEVPGITAAVGLLKTDLRYEHTEAVIVELDKVARAELARINAAVRAAHGTVQAELDNDGIARERQTIAPVAECRYQGQGFELRASMPEGEVTAENLHVVTDSFHDQHQADYGYSYRTAGVELITLRAIGSASTRRIDIPRIGKADGSSPDRALMFVRPTTFDDGRTLGTPRYDRTKLLAGDCVEEPAVLHQHDSTTLVPPSWVAETLDYGNTRISPLGA